MTAPAGQAGSALAVRLTTHPAVLAAITVLLVNDHWAKGRLPGALTGMLSDASGSFVLAALATAGWCAAAARTRPVRAAGVAAAATIGLVAAAKLTAWGATAAAWVGGLGRWPLDALVAVQAGQHLPALQPIGIARDPWDVVAAGAAGGVVLLARRAAATTSGAATAVR